VSRLVRAELFKLRTTPGAWVIIGVTVLLTALGVITAFVISHHDGTGPHFAAPVTVEQLRVLVGAGYQAGVVIAPVLGVLCITTEYRHKVISTTLLITPRREQVLLGKGVACVVWAALLWAASLVLVAALGLPLLAAQGGSVGDLLRQVAPVVPGLLGTFVLMAIFGLGLGILLRNQVAAVVLTLVITLVLEPLIVALASSLWHTDVNWLPSRAAAAVSGGLHRTMEGDGPLLSTWLGGLTLLAWGLGPAVLGYFTTFQRDVT
jgi:hypothetical protein